MKTTIRIKQINDDMNMLSGPMEMKSFLDNIPYRIGINYEIPVDKFIDILCGELGSMFWVFTDKQKRKKVLAAINNIINESHKIEKKYADE